MESQSELEVFLRLKGKYLKGTIDNWAKFPYGNNETIIGEFYSIDDDQDSTDIRTSYIVEIYEEFSIVETRDSYYKLGRPSLKFKY